MSTIYQAAALGENREILRLLLVPYLVNRYHTTENYFMKEGKRTRNKISMF
jgi:hypothetical protein